MKMFLPVNGSVNIRIICPMDYIMYLRFLLLEINLKDHIICIQNDLQNVSHLSD